MPVPRPLARVGQCRCAAAAHLVGDHELGADVRRCLHHHHPCRDVAAAADARVGHDLDRLRGNFSSPLAAAAASTPAAALSAANGFKLGFTGVSFPCSWRLSAAARGIVSTPSPALSTRPRLIFPCPHGRVLANVGGRAVLWSSPPERNVRRACPRPGGALRRGALPPAAGAQRRQGAAAFSNSL